MPGGKVSGRRAVRYRKEARVKSKAAVWVTVAVFALVFLVSLIVLRSGGGEPSDAEPYSTSSRAPKLVAGVAVEQPWADRGTIPLDTPVAHEWLLRNTGAQTVSLGEATIETLEGC